MAKTSTTIALVVVTLVAARNANDVDNMRCQGTDLSSMISVYYNVSNNVGSPCPSALREVIRTSMNGCDDWQTWEGGVESYEGQMSNFGRLVHFATSDVRLFERCRSAIFEEASLAFNASSKDSGNFSDNADCDAAIHAATWASISEACESPDGTTCPLSCSLAFQTVMHACDGNRWTVEPDNVSWRKVAVDATFGFRPVFFAREMSKVLHGPCKASAIQAILETTHDCNTNMQLFDLSLDVWVHDGTVVDPSVCNSLDQGENSTCPSICESMMDAALTNCRDVEVYNYTWSDYNKTLQRWIPKVVPEMLSVEDMWEISTSRMPLSCQKYALSKRKHHEPNDGPMSGAFLAHRLGWVGASDLVLLIFAATFVI